MSKAAGCGLEPDPLWTDAAASSLGYRPAAIFHAGIAGRPPRPEGAYGLEPVAPPDRDSPALVAWAAVYGVRAGDELGLSLVDDAGKTIAEHRVVAERNQARFFFYAERKRTATQWPAGEYAVTARLVRRKDAGRAPYTTERRAAVKLD